MILPAPRLLWMLAALLAAAFAASIYGVQALWFAAAAVVAAAALVDALMALRLPAPERARRGALRARRGAPRFAARALAGDAARRRGSAGARLSELPGAREVHAAR